MYLLVWTVFISSQTGLHQTITSYTLHTVFDLRVNVHDIAGLWYDFDTTQYQHSFVDEGTVAESVYWMQ